MLRHSFAFCGIRLRHLARAKAPGLMARKLQKSVSPEIVIVRSEDAARVFLIVPVVLIRSGEFARGFSSNSFWRSLTRIKRSKAGIDLGHYNGNNIAGRLWPGVFRAGTLTRRSRISRIRGVEGAPAAVRYSSSIMRDSPRLSASMMLKKASAIITRRNGVIEPESVLNMSMPKMKMIPDI